MVTLLTMTAHGVALLLSLGGFEYWLRVLPGANEEQRLLHLGRVVQVSSIAGLLVCLGVAVGFAPPAWYGDGTVQLSGAAVAVLFALVLHVQQRLYYLLGTQAHLRARVTQLLWSDLWYLFLLPFGAGALWNAEQVVWIWSLWMLALSLLTFTWVPLIPAVRASLAAGRDSRWVRLSLPILPIMLSEWIFRLSGQYVLLAETDAHTMALYALALNLSLVGYTAGVPLVDVCITQFNAQLPGTLPKTPPPELATLFTRTFRLVMVVCFPVAMALLQLPGPLLRLLASSTFAEAAEYLPYAAPIPFLMLTALLFARAAMSFHRTLTACVAGIGGGVLTILLSFGLVYLTGAYGMFLAVNLGLVVCVLLLFFLLGLYRWIRVRDLGLPETLGGTVLLYFVFAWINAFTQSALLALLLAGFATICVALVFRWISIKDLSLFQPSADATDVVGE